MRGWHTATLTEEDVLVIVKALDQGFKAPLLADEFGVSRQTINRINRGDRWGQLTGRGTDRRREHNA